MTSRALNDPNWLPAEPNAIDIRQSLIDIWSITSTFVSRETLDYSVTGNVSHEFVVMANTVSKTVTMVAEPEDGHKVTVVRTDAEVIIDGNTKTIADSATLTLGSVGASSTMIYSAADVNWWPI